MRIIRFVLGAAVLLLGSWGCGDDPLVGSSAVTSTSFTQGAAIPSKYTCDGVDISPQLAWTAIDGAQCYAVIMDDATATDFIHWILWGIPAQPLELAEDTAVGTPGTNESGNVGYGGPCPPRPGSGAPPALTGVHDYTISVFGLTQSGCDQTVANPAVMYTRADFRTGFQSQILGERETSFTYSR
jgi:Raf kinase inhibitor-like YbhB/YbcL family protein